MSSTDAASGSSSPPALAITLTDIRSAHSRIAPFIHRTPLLTSRQLDALATSTLLPSSSSSSSSRVRIRLAFKAEHLQRVGAFKMRGATNATLLALQDAGEGFEVQKLAVVTHSSGNHAAALACAAKSVGAKAFVVMPDNAPAPKKAAVAGYGAKITFCEPTLEARDSTAKAIMSDLTEQGQHCVFVHPYDDPRVMAGQGTIALELYEQVKALEKRAACSAAAEADKVVGSSQGASASAGTEQAWLSRGEEEQRWDFVVAPVGGGGMLSGLSTGLKGLDSRIDVRGAEPKDADDAYRSFASGTVEPAISPARTICDGLLTSLSARTLALIRQNVTAIHLCSDHAALRALRLLWTRTKQLVEPSACVGLAVVLENQEFGEAVREVARRKEEALKEGETAEIRIAVVLTGGNVELAKIVAALQEEEEASQAAK